MDRVTRLDAAGAAAGLSVPLTVEGPCGGGEVGAAYVRWPDGHRSVLTRGTAASAPLTSIARRAGVPAPRYELVEGPIVVQELLPGAPPAEVTADLIARMLAINARLAGLCPPGELDLHLRSSGPGFCLHEPLAHHSARTARLLSRIREVGEDHPHCAGTDLVHLDFHPGNVLVSPDGTITGVVDWDGAGTGDRWLDVVTLRFDLEQRAPELASTLDALLTASVPPERLRAYWAHMSLRLVDWSIRHHTPADVLRWMTLAETGLDLR